MKEDYEHPSLSVLYTPLDELEQDGLKQIPNS